MILKKVLGLTALVFLSFSSNATALDFQPGEYQITSSMQMPGMAPGTIPPQTVSQCMTRQDPIPKDEAASGNCRIKNMKQSGNTVSWEMECNQQGATMTSEGQVTYAGTSFEGQISMNMGPQAGNMSVITSIAGKRIGDCGQAQ